MFWLAVIGALLVLYVFYNRWSWIHSYWEFRGVPGPKPLPFVGNILQHVLGRKSLGDLCYQWYREYKDVPLVGFYNFMTPFVLVKRLDYVETVLIKEFSHFTDKTTPRTGKANMSDNFLFITTGKTWKALRTKITPVFTTGKLKGMLDQMKNCTDMTLKKVDEDLSGDISVDEFIKTYTIDVTAKVVFGVESDDISDPTSEFMVNCDKMFDPSGLRSLGQLVFFSFPKLANLLQIPLVPDEQVEYFRGLLTEVLRQRKETGVKRNDMVQLLLELKEKGQVGVDTWDEAEDSYLKITDHIKTTETVEMTDDLLISQAMIFLTTGLDTIASALIYTLVELCQNRQTMSTLLQEIDAVLDKHKAITYEALKDMKYLEMCLMEAMRLNPALTVVNRCCTRNYTFDNGLQVEKGTMMAIPILAIHMDPDIYPEPSKYKPERFSTPPQPATYLPFGDGPRICIAKRFAMLEMKVFMAGLLHKYQVKLSSKTKLPLSSNNRSLLLKPTSPAYFNLTKRPMT